MSILNEMRTLLANKSISELSLQEDQPDLVSLWTQMQSLKEEMNKAKKVAAAEVAKPYLDTLRKLEERYALLVRLSA